MMRSDTLTPLPQSSLFISFDDCAAVDVIRIELAVLRLLPRTTMTINLVPKCHWFGMQCEVDMCCENTF